AKQELWPLPKRRPKSVDKKLVAHLWGLPAGRIYLRQIPKGERLEGQWELPQSELSPREFEENTKKYNVIGPVSHSITRYRYQVLGELRSERLPPQGLRKSLSLQDFSLGDVESGALHVSTLTSKI